MATKSTTKADSLITTKEGYLANPLFDKRIYSMSALRGGKTPYVQPENTNNREKTKLRRGYMVSAGKDYNFDKKRYRVDFLYNPSEVAMSHTLDGQVAGATFAHNPADPGKALSPVNTSCAFNLLFDRTFETAQHSDVQWSVQQRGVLVDIDALYSLVGINQVIPKDSEAWEDEEEEPSYTKSTDIADSAAASNDALTESTHGAAAGVEAQANAAGAAANKEIEEKNKAIRAAKKAAAAAKKKADAELEMMGFDPNEKVRDVSGIMGMMPIKVIFGEPSERYLTFYGYIQSLDINYTHWTQNMTPSRASASISMQKLPQTVTAKISETS
jgi:hypothetical protein